MSITTRAKAVLDRDRLTPALASYPSVLLRVGLSAILTYFVGMAAFASLFIGSVATTGCFLTCEEPNLLAGIPLLVLGGILVVVTLHLLWWGLVDRYWRTASKVLAGIAIGGTMLLEGFWLGLFG